MQKLYEINNNSTHEVIKMNSEWSMEQYVILCENLGESVTVLQTWPKN